MLLRTSSCSVSDSFQCQIQTRHVGYLLHVCYEVVHISSQRTTILSSRFCINIFKDKSKSILVRKSVSIYLCTYSLTINVNIYDLPNVFFWKLICHCRKFITFLESWCFQLSRHIKNILLCELGMRDLSLRYCF